ncbi:pentatricopeptide repeat-containing protein At5g66520-like [Magnolia sinica]|uniref:pentatricopeptide repeat-containing protein At5g66520-like n=1 Tax=Magnolia sinica TaxID=86752 RepID=UPI00265A0001|nr:pentatricopeptide repeat-containing protein At5g66520-like [Magnolia sinica]
MGLLHHPNVAQSLSAFANMSEFKRAHAHIITSGLHRDSFTTARLLAFSAISQAGNLDYAKVLFEHIEHPTLYMYNSMIGGLSQSHTPLDSVSFYVRMSHAGISPDNFTFPLLIRSCWVSSCLDLGLQLHCHVLKFGLDCDVFVVNNLISMYSGFEELGCARHLFDECSGVVDVVSWTALVAGYSNCGELDSARWLFNRMPVRNAVSWNAMIVGYARSGKIGEAKKLFDEMPERNVATWSGMISGCSQCGLFKEALKLFVDMVGTGIMPNKPALVSAVSCCAQLRALDQGEWLHHYIMENKIEVDVALGTVLIDMYGKCGSIHRALQVFDEMPIKNILSWNSMISGMALNGCGKQALALFGRMWMMGLEPNGVTFIGVLSACSHTGLVVEGHRFFDFMTQVYGIKPQLEHYGCMVDLLGRAGLIKEALSFVEGMPVEPHPGLWGALVGACRIHGEVKLGEELGKRLIDLEPHHGGRYVLLSNIYAAARRWDDVAMVRKLLKDRKVLKAAGNSAMEV